MVFFRLGAMDDNVVGSFLHFKDHLHPRNVIFGLFANRHSVGP